MPYTDLGVVSKSLMLAKGVGGITISVGVLVLAGWMFDVHLLTTIAIGYASMKPATAVCFIFIGFELLLRVWTRDGNRALQQKIQLCIALCSIVVIAISGSMLFEYVSGANVGIDSVLMPQAARIELVPYPGRMSPVTCIEFLLLVGTLALIDVEIRGTRPAQYLALIVMLIGFVALLGYLYDVRALYRVNVFSTMALHTAVLFILIGFSALVVRPNKGLMAHLISIQMGGVMARSILPLAIIVPVVVGWVRLKGERLGWYGTEFGLALLVTVNIVIFAFLVWRNAASLNRADSTRRASELTIERTASELRTTIALLEASQELHHMAVTAAGLGTWRQDLRSGEYRCSDNFRVLLGLDADAPLSRESIMEKIHTNDRAMTNEIRDRILTGPGIGSGHFETEFRVTKSDGSARWLASKGQGYYDIAGNVTTIQGVVMDISTRKVAEEERARVQNQLRQAQKLSALGTLAAGIAHDFNNLLSAIVGNTKLATEEIAADHPAKVSLNEIEKAAHRAGELVQRILAFSRGQDGRPTALQLRSIVEEVVKLLRASVPAMIDIRTSFSRDTPNVFVDASQIHEVIMNLATNAVHAIGDNTGLIHIAVDVVTVDADLARTYAELHEGQYVTLSVSDSGCGMEKEIVERIFEPFYTTKSSGSGTGLGLSVVHGIVSHYGGAITVYSQLGKGTKFNVYFPASMQAVTLAVEKNSSDVIGHGERVLYVDDEEPLVFLVTRSLEKLNYRVFGYTDAAQALAVFRARPRDFDVVVTDLSMPRMSGFNLARELMRVRPEIPIILTSGYVRHEDTETAERIGIRAVIAKPNTIEALSHVLETLFSGLGRA